MSGGRLALPPPGSRLLLFQHSVTMYLYGIYADIVLFMLQRMVCNDIQIHKCICSIVFYMSRLAQICTGHWYVVAITPHTLAA